MGWSLRWLADGRTYHLRLSTAAGTTYTTFPVRAGLDKGLSSSIFSGGRAQSTTDGSKWKDLYGFGSQNLQFYFTLASTPPPLNTPSRAPTR